MVNIIHQKSENASNVNCQIYKTLSRQITFPARRLESVEDVDAYVESMRKLLMETLESCDGIQLN